MRQLLALSFVMTAAAFVSADTPAPKPALPPINDPVYASIPKGGYKVEGGAAAERCRLPASSAAKIAAPAAAADMGDELCKHHVWKLLLNEEAWNAGRAVKRADWGNLTGDQQLQKLGEVKSYFAALDGAYKGVLDSARAVVAAYAEQNGEAKIWDRAARKSGPALAAYYKALYALEMFINGGARNSPAVLPQPQPDVLERVDPVILRMLKSADEVLGDQLVAIHAEMETARAQAAGTGNPTPAVGNAERRVDQRVADWNAAVKGADMDAALGRAFDAAAQRGQLTEGEAQGARSVLSGKAMVVKSNDGRQYVAQPVTLPPAGGKGDAVQTFKYAEIRPDSTVDSVSQELVDAIRSDRKFQAVRTGLVQASREAAANPGRTAREAAQNLAQEQGPFAFMSGQTRPDMERKLEAERSRDASKANDDFTAAGENMQKEFDAAWAECGTLWAQTENDEAQINKSLQGSDKASSLERLEQRRAGLTVAGPSEKGVAERKRVPCTKDRQALRDAYLDARDAARAALANQTQRLEAVETLEKGKLDEKEKARRQLRRQYFRDELVKSKPKFEAKLASSLEADTKKAFVNAYLVANFPDSSKAKFYLSADWKPSPAPAAAQFGQWAALESSDPIKTAKEDTFIREMDGSFPMWKQSAFNRAAPANDDVIRTEAQKWIAADFDAWLDKKKLENKSGDAPNLSKYERPRPPTPPAAK